jgi:hypothetical protein
MLIDVPANQFHLLIGQSGYIVEGFPGFRVDHRRISFLALIHLIC